MPEIDITTYARLSMFLSKTHHPEERARILAEHGLDEAGWGTIDDIWQARLSEAEPANEDAIPPLVATYAQAFAQAQQETISPAVLSLEVYLDITKALGQGKPPDQTFTRFSTTLGEYLQAHRHWTILALQHHEIAKKITKR